MLDLNEIEVAYEAWSSNPNECWIERGERVSELLAWLPALVTELTQARAERDTLSALLPLYYAVDEYLWDTGLGYYPEGHCNPDRLEALRVTFLKMSTEREDG